MCGLFGVASNYLIKDEIIRCEQLGMLNIFRGYHATGLAIVQVPEKNLKKNIYRVDRIKKTDAAYDFFMDEKVNELLYKQPNNKKFAILGHTRHATVGKHTVEMAHPHRFKHITGCHNGTIHEFTGKDLLEEFGSDSRVLFHKIAEEGLVSALEQTGHFGAWAITYVDDTDATINFVRNKERPLSLMFDKSRSVLYWASEERVLRFMAAEDPKAYLEPFMLPEKTLYKFKIGHLQNSSKEELKLVFRYRPYKIQDHDAKDYTPWWSSMWEKAEAAEAERAKNVSEYIETSEGIWVPKETVEKNKKKDIEYYYLGYRGRVLSIEEANVTLASGCSWCSSGKDIGCEVRWVDHDQFVCMDCKDDPIVKDYLLRGDEFKGTLMTVLPDNEVDGEETCC